MGFIDYIVRVGDAASQLANVTLLLGDNPNESISGRCYRKAVIEGSYNVGWRVGYFVVNVIFFFQENHCREAYYGDLARAKRLTDRHYPCA